MSVTNLFLTDEQQDFSALNGANGTEIITIDERTFVYVAAEFADTVSIFELFADGRLDEVGSVVNVFGQGLDGVSGLVSATVGGSTYLYAAGENSDALTVFSVGLDGTLTSVQTIFDSDNAAFELDGVFGEMTIASAGSNQFLITQGLNDDGLSVWQIGNDGLLTNTDNLNDADQLGFPLDGASDTAFIEFQGTSFVFASGTNESAVGVFSLSATGQLTLLSSIADSGDLELFRAFGVEAVEINGALFLYVGGNSDSGLSVFSVSATGGLTNLFNYSDDQFLELSGVQDLDVFEIDGTSYLAATGNFDSGVTLFTIGTDGSLTAVDSVTLDFNDADPLLLSGTRELEFVEIDGQGFLVVTADNSDAVSVFRLDPNSITLTGTAAPDLLVGGESNEEIEGLDGGDIILANGGDDTVIGGQGDDLVDGGEGDDRLEGDGSLTQTESDVVTVTDTGQDLALSVTLPESADGSTIEISGVVSRIPNQGADYNIVYVIDNSGSMGGTFSGTETVGDLNGDGTVNTLLDGTIAAFQSLNDSLLDSGLGDSDVAVVSFNSSATEIFSGTARGGVDAALESLNDTGGTNFDNALQQTINTLGTMGSGQNVVYFISDGEDFGSSLPSFVSTLTDPNGLNTIINAYGLGNGANLDQLDIVDDGIDNDSAIRVLEPSLLTAGLTGSPVATSEVDRLEVYVNGALFQTVPGTDFTITPLGLQYNATLTGLSTSAGDVIEVVLVASDTAATQVSVELEVPNDALDIGDDTLIGGAGDDTLNGEGGNDRLMGGIGEDLLNGGSGDDLLTGGADGDRIFGDGGNDTLVGDAGIDTLLGGIGNDIYYVEGRDLVDESGGGSMDFDTIATAITTDLTNLRSNFLGDFEAIRLIGSIDATARGDNTDNRLDGNDGDNLLVGRDGDDSLFGGRGDDRMAGGDDNDSMNGDSGDDTLFGNDGADTLRGGTGDDDLFGSNGSDLLLGDDGNDSLEGGGSTDTLVGGNGNDRLNGGGNSDRLLGNNGNDTIIGETGADDISGGNDNDVLSGRDQNDTIRGGNGEDRIFGGNDADLLSGNNGDDEISAGNGNDRAFGGADNDTLDGGTGNDSLGGGSGNDRIDGGTGNDTMNGDAGNDTLIGEDGADQMDGGDGNDILSGRNDNDTIRGGDDDDRILGGGGNDLVIGNNDDDELYGGSNDDRLFGGNGNDTLAGDSGSDTLNGGSGADVFVFNDLADSPHNSGRDTITDFIVGEDFIDLSGFAGTLSFVSAFSGAGNEVRYNDAIGRLYVDIDGESGSDLSVDLDGSPSLTASDLIL